MAATYSPQQALETAKKFIHNMPVEDVAVRILDNVCKQIWHAAPWRWTIGAMPSVNLASTTTTYAVTLPSDFLYLTEANLSDGRSLRNLEIVSFAPPTSASTGVPSEISIAGVNPSATYVVFPTPGTIPASPTQTIFASYKKAAPTIQASNTSTGGVLVMDDDWFWVFEEGVLWRAYVYANNPKAGSATVDSSGRLQFSGQLGAFMAALEWMKVREPLPSFHQRAVNDQKSVTR